MYLDTCGEQKSNHTAWNSFSYLYVNDTYYLAPGLSRIDLFRLFDTDTVAIILVVPMTYSADCCSFSCNLFKKFVQIHRIHVVQWISHFVLTIQFQQEVTLH